MKLHTVAVWALLGMVSTSAAALAIPVPKAQKEAPGEGPTVSPPKETSEPWHFTAGKTLTVDARLGHASLQNSASGETYLFASVTGSDTPSAEAPPLNLALVIDRSGSMAGVRFTNALAAAAMAVDRMREIDTLTVVSFDVNAKVVVAPTRTTSAARPGILSAIRSLRVGGDTCISCGLDEAMHQLDSVKGVRGQINRMVLLSDGEPTHGVKAVPAFRSMSARMRDRGFAITTIGVDTQYEEKVMTAIAEESNGQHFFVANPSGLPAIFSSEFESLVASVASESELIIELAPGVTVDEVFDRTFRREGQKVIVPFGTFSTKQEKTVLMKVRVSAESDGKKPIAQVRLAYRDLVQRTDGLCSGELAVQVKSDGTEQRDLDPFVEARITRSKTAAALQQANKLLAQGKVNEAKLALATQHTALAKVQRDTLDRGHFAPKKARGRDLDEEFAQQAQAMATAEANLAPTTVTRPPVAAAAGAAARPAPAPRPETTPSVPFSTRSNAKGDFDMRQ